MERIESTTTCEFCGTENRLTALGVLVDEPMRCSHCGLKLGNVTSSGSESALAAHSRGKENPAGMKP